MENNTENVKTPVTEAELAECQALCDAVRDQRSPYWQADRDRLAIFAAPALIVKENHPVLAFFLAYLACELIYHAAGMVKHFHTGGAV